QCICLTPKSNSQYSPLRIFLFRILSYSQEHTQDADLIIHLLAAILEFHGDIVTNTASFSVDFLRRLQIDPYLSPCTKLKSKWIKNLNINPVTLNLIEDKVGSILKCIDTGDHFLNIIPIAQTLSATINQWDYMKLRTFCKAKDTITKTKRQPTEWEKIFTNPTSDRGLISRIYKELKKHDIKTPDNPIEKMDYRVKQRIYGRRISKGRKTFKDVLNILTHQRNANPNNSEIPSYACQND
ncbi:hypothetical protein STEG23_026866, partial [Scotinomys teguina]